MKVKNSKLCIEFISNLGGVWRRIVDLPDKFSIQMGSLLFLPLLFAQVVSAGTGSEERDLQWSKDVASQLVKELASICPMEDPSDLAKFNECRQGITNSIVVAENMDDRILWGGKKANKTLSETVLTEMAAPVWQGMYLPLMMFTGHSEIEFDEKENRVLLRAEARFRSQLMPGNYPYPFWHSDGKWKAYQGANEVVFFISPEKAKVTEVIRSPRGRKNPTLDIKFVGALTEFKEDEWMWKDDKGQLQPKVTLFDGLYNSKNPHLASIESTYRSLALKMRDNNCMACHVPNNPEDAQTLLLLQTPVHAAGEIDDIIRTVRAGVMPMKFIGGKEGITDPKEKRLFLERAEAFKLALDNAEEWEEKN